LLFLTRPASPSRGENGLRLKVFLSFLSPLRATKPDHDLVEAHIDSLRGRIIPLIRRELDKVDEETIARELENWKKHLLNVFPRKKYNGCEQVCIPSTWVLGAMRARASALKMRVGQALINSIKISPTLIGLRNRDGPMTPEKIEYMTDTITSNDRFGRRTALKVFEMIFPPAWTESIIIDVFNPMLKKETIAQLLEFGRMGASRTQGYGAFRGKIIGEG
jgi:hypothetical protein